MDFLQQSDYNSFINPQLLNMLLEGDSDKLEDAEDMASGYINSNLSARYNLTTEFSRSGGGRNKTLVRWMLSLSVYYLHNTVADTDIPERVAKTTMMCVRRSKPSPPEKWQPTCSRSNRTGK